MQGRPSFQTSILEIGSFPWCWVRTDETTGQQESRRRTYLSIRECWFIFFLRFNLSFPVLHFIFLVFNLILFRFLGMALECLVLPLVSFRSLVLDLYISSFLLCFFHYIL